jgi:hypothetical protein
MANGKGSQIRKGANLKKYWENYDAIFRKPKPEKESPKEEQK